MRPNYEYNFGIKDSDTPSYIKRVLSKLRVCVFGFVCEKVLFPNPEFWEKSKEKFRNFSKLIIL